MIPKIIHYCWFGRGEKPDLALRCIESWRKYCPDYEFIEWNEDTFDVTKNRYVREAYESRKYAFVTDYVRLYAMYTYGGIYMDTDVMVCKPLDDFLSHKAVSGFENQTQIPTGIMACEKGFWLFNEFLKYYDTAKFIREDGTLNLKTNVETITEMMIKRGFMPNNKFQIVDGFALYPQNVFCPDHSRLGDTDYIKDAVTIHYFAGSWKSEATKKRESAWWWRWFVVPMSNLSHRIEKVGGMPYKRLKKMLWESLLKEKS